MIHQNVSLEYVNISGCCCQAKDFEKVSKSLVILKSLHHLDLSCNSINVASADNVAAIIANNVFLENLNLSNCKSHESVFLSIIIAMKNTHHLKCVYLNSISLSYEESTEIAKVISNNPFLEIVNFSNCSLTEVGMENILLSLKNHTSLKFFDISYNRVTNKVVNEIADVISYNNQLTHLNISNSEIQEYGILKIFKAATRINTLKCIKLCNCIISD